MVVQREKERKERKERKKRERKREKMENSVISKIVASVRLWRMPFQDDYYEAMFKYDTKIEKKIAIHFMKQIVGDIGNIEKLEKFLIITFSKQEMDSAQKRGIWPVCH